MLSWNATSSHSHEILMIFSDHDHDSDNGNLKIMETENTPQNNLPCVMTHL